MYYWWIIFKNDNNREKLTLIMTQITEDYVSFEIAKLLKEKGFDGECDYWYGEYGEICCSPSVISVECWCPSQSLTLKWLREVH